MLTVPLDGANEILVVKVPPLVAQTSNPEGGVTTKLAERFVPLTVKVFSDELDPEHAVKADSVPEVDTTDEEIIVIAKSIKSPSIDEPQLTTGVELSHLDASLNLTLVNADPIGTVKLLVFVDEPVLKSAKVYCSPNPLEVPFVVLN